MAGLIDRDRVRELIARGAQLIEVLPAKEYADDHLPGALSIPLPRIDRATAERLDLKRPVIVYCWDSA